MHSRVLLCLALFMIALLFPQIALADIADNNLLNSIIDEYRTRSAAWGGALITAALWLFWMLAGIEFSWTAIQLALTRADFQDWVAEIVRFIIIIGFFFALLTHQSDWARAIVDSFRQLADIANTATAGTPTINPSNIFDIGLTLANRVAAGVSFWSPADSLGLVISALVIIVCFALIAAELLVALVTVYLLINAGIILMGFGGSRFTKNFAVQFWITVIGASVKLFAMQLLVGLGYGMISGWATDFTESNSQILVLVGAAVVMYFVIKIIPAKLEGIINGSAFGGGVSVAGTLTAAASTAVTVAAGLTAGTVGAGVALREAARLAGSQGAGGLWNLAANTTRNLTAAAVNDLSTARSGGGSFNRLTGMGRRMAANMREQREGGLGLDGNTIGPAET